MTKTSSSITILAIALIFTTAWAFHNLNDLRSVRTECDQLKKSNDTLVQTIDYIKNNGTNLQKFEAVFYEKNKAMQSTFQQLQKAGKNQESDLLLMHNCYSAYMETCAEWVLTAESTSDSQ